MTGRTHKLSGKLMASLMFVGLSSEKLITGISYLMGHDFSEITAKITTGTYWLDVFESIAILVLLRIIAKAASVIPDYDQKADSMPNKDSLLAKFFNKLLGILGAHHRSRHTHSIDLSLIFCAGIVFVSAYFTGSTSVTTVLAGGIACGILSHIVADMFNGTGVHITFLSKKMVSFVPKRVNTPLLLLLGVTMMGVGTFVVLATHYSLAGLILCSISSLLGAIFVGFAICCRGMRFNTGGQWEDIFYKVTNVIDVITTTVAFLICFII